MSKKRKSFGEKIFGIGFHKTGTTSLHIFLKLLGYHGIHWPNHVKGINYQKLCIPHLHDNSRVVDILMPVFTQFETFTDLPIPGLYRELDERFPGSRFILVEREPEDWWASLINHWHLPEEGRRTLDPYEYLQYNYADETPLTEVTVDSKAGILHRYNRHLARVKTYFEGRPDALISVAMDDPEMARKLADFLQASDVPKYPRIRRSSVAGPPSLKGWRG